MPLHALSGAHPRSRASGSEAPEIVKYLQQQQLVIDTRGSRVSSLSLRLVVDSWRLLATILSTVGQNGNLTQIVRIFRIQNEAPNTEKGRTSIATKMYP